MVVSTESNRFVRLGPGFRPLAQGDSGSVTLGLLPYALFEDIGQTFIELLKTGVR